MFESPEFNALTTETICFPVTSPNIGTTHPVLTRSQEYHLFRQYNYAKYKGLDRQVGETRRVIIEHNCRLVKHVCKSFSAFNLEFDENVNEGILALCKAIDAFDYRRGFKFSTYATIAIVRNLMRLRAQEAVRKDRFLTMDNGDMVLGQDDCVHNTVSRRLDIEAVRTSLDDMEEGDRLVLKCRLMDGMSYKEVGEKIGVSSETVKVRERKAALQFAIRFGSGGVLCGQ